MLFCHDWNNKIFDILKIPRGCLDNNPSNWKNSISYMGCKSKVFSMKVTNDTAERGVSLIQNYLHVLTKDEEQRQYLLQIVSEHRKKFPDSKKATIVAGLK